MNEQYAEVMTKFPLFEGHTAQGAQFLIERGEVKEHAAGAVLCREGDAATFVLLVLSGKVEVFVERSGQTLVLTEAGPGSILGELAVLCGIPRSASLRASERLVALHWENEGFRRMLLSNASLSQRILRQSLRTLIEKEQALLNSPGREQGDQSHAGSL
jgi:CRP-like cAMP-binding protein